MKPFKGFIERNAESVRRNPEESHSNSCSFSRLQPKRRQLQRTARFGRSFHSLARNIRQTNEITSYLLLVFQTQIQTHLPKAVFR